MTPEAQSISIAEFCGYVPGRETRVPFRKIWTHPDNLGDCWTYDDLPHYLEDMNAIRDAVLQLDGFAYEHFVEHLLRVANPNTDRLSKDWTWEEIGRAIKATTAQRCKALLRTIGKWEDGK